MQIKRNPSEIFPLKLLICMLKLKIVKRSLILGEVDVVADMAVEDMAVDVVEVDMAVDVGVVDMAAAAVIHFFSLS